MTAKPPVPSDRPVLILTLIIACAAPSGLLGQEASRTDGQDSKMIMLDGVTLQNNYNNAEVETGHHYRNGAGVFIRTEGDIPDRQAEFVMKGGVIQGNYNDVQSYIACGGGVFIAGFGIFRMEGGGFHTGGRGSFY